MKENAQRILTWLYPAERASRWVAVSELPLVAPDLTAGGVQSVLGYLQQRRRVVLERVSGVPAVSITTHGMRALEAKIPALAPSRRAWKGQWQAVFFLTAPSGDKNFRFLRRLLVEHFAVAVSRGVYLYPGGLPERLSFELRQGYEGAVMVTELADWTYGDEKEILGRILHWGDLMNAYSSISREVDRLLRIDSTIKGLNYQQKLQFSSVFSRLFNVMRGDFGLQKHYFPQGENGVDLLFSLHALSALGEE